MFCQKSVLKNSQKNSQKNTRARVSFLIKLQAFLRKPFLTEHPRWLLLFFVELADNLKESLSERMFKDFRKGVLGTNGLISPLAITNATVFPFYFDSL